MIHEFYQRYMLGIFPRISFFLSMARTFFLLVYSNPSSFVLDSIYRFFSSFHMPLDYTTIVNMLLPIPSPLHF
jgi:hypothetical protein